MSVAEKEPQTVGVPQERTAVDSAVAGEDGDKKASKVSKLREMFQTGSVRPVEDWAGNDANLTKEQIRLLRSCPGSPPLMALRERRPVNATNVTGAKPSVPNGAVPPARPPKPKDLWRKSGLTPRHVLPNVKSRISPRLLKMFVVFEGGAVPAQTRPTPASVPSKTDATAAHKPKIDASKTATVTSASVASSVIQPPSAVPESALEVETPKKTADISSTVSADVSSLSADLSATAEEDLQHAEPIAVATADEDEDEESVENEMERLGLTTVPHLEPPPGLKVVAVDALGVHILEDGNFYYAVPAASADAESSPTSAPNVVETSQSAAGAPETDLSVPTSDTGDGGSSRRVRFSDAPVIVFSTHAKDEYDRTNDEIDPVASSAAYELEKRLETMELVEVDLKKGPQGLGVNIVGVGLDYAEGENLGVFIKTVVPGGAADLSQLIKPNDQIVKIDGINMVGVSCEFAAQTLRNTGETVHFVLGRATDSANLWMLADPEENGDENTTDEPSSSTRKIRQNSITQPEPLRLNDSFETLHKMLLHEEVEDDHGKTDSIDISSDNEFPFGNDTIHSDHCNPPLNGQSGGSNGVSSPRSALKGTATAASTKRRHDAVVRLIELAAEKPNGPAGPSEAAFSLSPGFVTNGVLWALASDLLDTKNQVTKLQSQVQTLEQQLTAQEAAADEAIERLRMQCIQLEWELQDAKDLRMQNTRRNSGPAPNGTPFHIPRTCPIYRRNRSLTSDADPRLPPLGSVAPVSLGKGEDRSDSAPFSDWFASDRCEAWHCSGFGSNETDPIRPASQASEVYSCPTSNVSVEQDPTYVQRNRLHLVSSGGFAKRRPRTRLEINPPPFDINWPSGEVCRQISSSHNTPPSPSNPGICATAPKPATRSEPVTVNSTSSPNRRSAPLMGVQLPGLTDVAASSVLLRVRRGDWDHHSESPTQTCISSPVIVQQSLEQ